jgi:hypothetical protein
MPVFTRKNGKQVLIATNAFQTIIKAIKAEPGLETFDYEAKTLVAVSTINHILECTAEGHRLVKAGKVAYNPNRPGVAPAWTKIKGAVLPLPTVKAVAALRFDGVRLQATDIAAEEVRSDYTTLVDLADEAALRPSASPRLRAARRDRMVEISNGQATREDVKSKVIDTMRVEMEAVKDYNRLLKETVELRAQLMLVSPKDTNGQGGVLIPA